MSRTGAFELALPCLCLALALGSGCAAQASRRPLRTAEIDTGAGTTEAVRRQLAGSWSLASFTVFGADGTPTDVKATGRLTYDQFGNLALTGTLADPAAAGAHASALSFKGRAVIDTGGQRLVLADVTGNVDPAALPATMSPDEVRFYAIEGSTLSLETRDGARVLARTVWHKDTK